MNVVLYTPLLARKCKEDSRIYEHSSTIYCIHAQMDQKYKTLSPKHMCIFCPVAISVLL
jgi:hypothetical protein